MLRYQDLSDVVKIGHTAFECGEVDELRREILNLALEAFRAERGVFFKGCTGASPRVEAHTLITRGIEESTLSSYQRYYFEKDPFIKKSLLGSQVIETSEDVIPSKELEQSAYYHEFLKPQSIYHQLVFFLRSEQGLLGLMAIFRSQQEHEFSRYELAKAELTVPYITSAYDRLTLKRKLLQTKAIMNSVFSGRGSEGFIALDESLEPIYINDAACKTLHDLGEAIDTRGDSAPSLPSKLKSRCRTILEHSRNREAADKPQRIIAEKTSHGDTIAIDFKVIEDSQSPGLCLLKVKQDNPSLPYSELLAQQDVGLTRRESEIAALVCRGLKDCEIGQKLFISEHTVGNHLRAIYEKLHVNNRAGLVYRVIYGTNRI